MVVAKSMSKQLPAYFKDYLDEKFEHTNDKINGLTEEVSGVKEELKKINGDIVSMKEEQARVVMTQKIKQPLLDKTVRGVKENRRRIWYIGVFIVLGSFIWIKESRDLLLSVISQLFLGM